MPVVVPPEVMEMSMTEMTEVMKMTAMEMAVEVTTTMAAMTAARDGWSKGGG